MVVGATVVLPFCATLPSPLMVTVEAPLVVQLKVVCCAGWMLVRLAVHSRICGLPEGAAPTVTTAVWVTVPLGPTAVSV